jgi:hypothetical protein
VTLALAGAVLAVGVVSIQSAFGIDTRAEACGAKRGSVRAAFEVRDAARVRGEHLPGMLPAPEIDTSHSPAYVVLFDGPVRLPTAAFMEPTVDVEYGNVVCVLVDGRAEYYVDVNTAGWSP